MKKRIALMICLTLTALLASGCVLVNFSGPGSVRGSGDMERFSFETGEITHIRVNILCDIEYRATGSGAVTLDIQPNLMEYVRVEESDGVLNVRSTRTINWNENKTPVLTVASPALETVTLNGAGTFKAEDTIKADSFTINFAGAGAVFADLDVGYLGIDISGAGTAGLTGRADTADIRMSGAGTINALELQTKDTKVNLAGAGSIEIACSDNLRVDASGAGSIEYKGSPSMDIDRSGLVRVSKVD